MVVEERAVGLDPGGTREIEVMRAIGVEPMDFAQLSPKSFHATCEFMESQENVHSPRCTSPPLNSKLLTLSFTESMWPSAIGLSHTHIPCRYTVRVAGFSTESNWAL